MPETSHTEGKWGVVSGEGQMMVDGPENNVEVTVASVDLSAAALHRLEPEGGPDAVYTARAETQAGKRAGDNFLSGAAMRQYTHLEFQAVDKEPQTLTLYANHGGLGGHQKLATLTLYKGNVQRVQINQFMREADSLFPAGVCTACSFKVFGANLK